jgi:hypothetical protein
VSICPGGRSRQTGLGEVHDPAATKDGGKLPVAAPESGSMPMHLATQAPPDVLRRTLEATPVRSAREKREPTETGWVYLLSFAALLMLVFGIWAATQSHAWTPLWPLNVVGGLMSYVPVVLLIAYGDRLPDRRLFRWPARVVALILTVAIPFLIWGPVPAPPS